jgi:hypothetical protein
MSPTHFHKPWLVCHQPHFRGSQTISCLIYRFGSMPLCKNGRSKRNRSSLSLCPGTPGQIVGQHVDHDRRQTQHDPDPEYRRMVDASPVARLRCGFHFDYLSGPTRPSLSGNATICAYWQIIFPSGWEQNSTLPVQRSSRCTPMDDETICHLNSIASEITMSTVATMTVAGMRRPITPICPCRCRVQSKIDPETLRFLSRC